MSSVEIIPWSPSRSNIQVSISGLDSSERILLLQQQYKTYQQKQKVKI